MKVKLLLTGGTIDKQYDEIEAKLVFVDTHVREMLKQARSRLDIDIEKLMLLDSLDITDELRQKILEACVNSNLDHIVITHGTSRLIETAELLGRNIHNKTIVLVGSMIPYRFKDSDALFNLGSALAAVQILGEGVFVTMNGKIFSWNSIAIDRKLGEFIQKSDVTSTS